MKKIILPLLLTFSGQSYAGLDLFGTESPLCNVAAAGWKDRKNFTIASMEYCIKGTSYQEVLNFTQTPIYIASLNTGDTLYKVEAFSRFKLPTVSPIINFMSQTDAAFYRISTKLIITDVQDAKITKKTYNETQSNLPYLSAQEVEPFYVDEIGFVFPTINYNLSAAEARAIPVNGGVGGGGGFGGGAGGGLGTSVIIGAGNGVINSIDPINPDPGNIIRGGLLGGLGGAAGHAMRLPTGAGKIWSAWAGSSFTLSMKHLCAECHTVDEKGKH